MARTNTVTSKDRGLNAMIDRLARAAGATRSLKVGIIDGDAPAEGSIDGLTIAELGEIHEFGLGVPQRSFLRDWFDETEAAHVRQFSQMSHAIVKGKIDSWEQGLERLGSLYVAEVQKRISSGIAPPLSEGTIKAKGSSVPLIDTGQLRSSITYAIE